MTEWTCRVCELTFDTELNIKSHISREHSDLDKDFESLQTTASAHITAWIRQQRCPFCGTFPSQTKRQFISHVSRHLQEISHAAIPPSAMQDDPVEVGDDSEDEALGERAGQSDQDALDQSAMMNTASAIKQPQSEPFDEPSGMNAENEASEAQISLQGM